MIMTVWKIEKESAFSFLSVFSSFINDKLAQKTYICGDFLRFFSTFANAQTHTRIHLNVWSIIVFWSLFDKKGIAPFV